MEQDTIIIQAIEQEVSPPPKSPSRPTTSQSPSLSSSRRNSQTDEFIYEIALLADEFASKHISDVELDNKIKVPVKTKKSEKKERRNATKFSRLVARFDELKKMVQKIHVNPDSLKMVLPKRTFYLNFVKDGEILNAKKLNVRMKKNMIKVSGAQNNYLKCACPICLELGIDTFGRSNSLLEHMRRQEAIKIQCVYCDKFFTSWQRIQDHLRNCHWKAGEIYEILG